jgi:hypothetical protein
MLYVSRCMLHVVRCTLYVACCMVYVVAGAADEPEDPDHSAKIILGEASVFSKQSSMHMSHSPDEAVLVMVRTFHTVAATPPDTAGAVAVADGCSCNCAADAPIPPIHCPDVAPAVLHAFLSLLMDHSALCSAHVRARTFGSGRAHHRRMHRTWCRRCRRLRCSRCIGLTTTALARRIKSQRCVPRPANVGESAMRAATRTVSRLASVRFDGERIGPLAHAHVAPRRDAHQDRWDRQCSLGTAAHCTTAGACTY